MNFSKKLWVRNGNDLFKPETKSNPLDRKTLAQRTTYGPVIPTSVSLTDNISTADV
jgi:hypothetical protein